MTWVKNNQGVLGTIASLIIAFLALGVSFVALNNQPEISATTLLADPDCYCTMPETDTPTPTMTDTPSPTITPSHTPSPTTPPVYGVDNWDCEPSVTNQPALNVNPCLVSVPGLNIFVPHPSDDGRYECNAINYSPRSILLNSDVGPFVNCQTNFDRSRYWLRYDVSWVSGEFGTGFYFNVRPGVCYVARMIGRIAVNAPHPDHLSTQMSISRIDNGIEQDSFPREFETLNGKFTHFWWFYSDDNPASTGQPLVVVRIDLYTIIQWATVQGNIDIETIEVVIDPKGMNEDGLCANFAIEV